jgi:hypothetical protein
MARDQSSTNCGIMMRSSAQKNHIQESFDPPELAGEDSGLFKKADEDAV